MSGTIPAGAMVGVDTRKHIHAAAAIDALGARLGATTVPVGAEDLGSWRPGRFGPWPLQPGSNGAASITRQKARLGVEL
jgi:hypothetical protein